MVSALTFIKSRARMIERHHKADRRAALELAKWDWQSFFSRVKFANANRRGAA